MSPAQVEALVDKHRGGVLLSALRVLELLERSPLGELLLSSLGQNDPNRMGLRQLTKMGYAETRMVVRLTAKGRAALL
uniref:Uncharacterized protein n=1 Tax=viral metagenome TaxID=1070528 RepID=A0A6H2A095_9ZZZZ